MTRVFCPTPDREKGKSMSRHTRLRVRRQRGAMVCSSSTTGIGALIDLTYGKDVKVPPTAFFQWDIAAVDQGGTQLFLLVATFLYIQAQIMILLRSRAAVFIRNAPDVHLNPREI